MISVVQIHACVALSSISVTSTLVLGNQQGSAQCFTLRDVKYITYLPLELVRGVH